MRTNKRTVWFLTLLSLVAVISISYMNKKAPLPFEGITIFGDSSNPAELKEKGAEDGKQPVFAESYLFENMRMEVSNERSQLRDQLTTKLNEAEESEAKNAAYDEMEALIKQESTESLLEMQIVALGYTDAFVRTNGSNAEVTVLSDESLSAKQAEEITYLIMTSWEDARKVKVDTKSES